MRHTVHMDARPLFACLALVAAPLLGTAGCSGSDAGAEDSSSAGCPAKADSCPAGCEDVKGQPIDYATCSLGEYTHLGCYPAGGGGLLLYGCIRDAATGTAYQLPTVSHEALTASDEWMECPSNWYASLASCNGG